MLSVIIPVYNVEAYVARCIDSVLSQSADFEIILVNDGSTDASAEICQAYAAKDSRIRLIHKENGGLSSARNAGIDLAVGEYLLFLDSDDYLVPDSLYHIQQRLQNQNCDIFVGCAKTVDEQGAGKNKANYNITPGSMSGKEYLQQLAQQRGAVSFCAQFVICRRAFIKERQLRFEKDILHEDELWTPMVLLKADRVYYSGICFYNHFVRTGSIMHSKNYDKRVASIIKVCEKLQQIYKQYPRSQTRYLRDRMAMIYLSTARYVTDTEAYVSAVGRTFPLQNARKLRTFCKSVLFCLAPRKYIAFLKR